MSNIEKLAENYIEVWNETDGERRRALIASTFAAGATYVDPLAAVQGHDALDGLIGQVHDRFPGFRFSLDGKVDGYANRMRFSWGLAPEGHEALIRGTDVAEIDDSRFASVIGFIDQMPVIS